MFRLLLLLLVLLTSCAPSPRFTYKKTRFSKAEAEEINAKVDIPAKDLSTYSNASVIESVTGIASYYADKFNGRLTFTEEVYDMYGLTAAHPSYPMHTILRVTNIENGKSVIVRVNDRMPKRPDRIIDLSLGTARAIQMVEKGLAEVRLDILEWGSE